MTSLPGRLIAFLVASALAGAFILFRGLTSDGEPRIVWTICGAGVLVGVFLILFGWWNKSRRRR
jgi:high-affinity Fe2+/Pb2+ permease